MRLSLALTHTLILARPDSHARRLQWNVKDTNAGAGRACPSLALTHSLILARPDSHARRCVFIHDPRIRGPTDATLYQRSNSSRGDGGTSMGSPFGRDIFYWPDMPRTDAQLNTASPFR